MRFSYRAYETAVSPTDPHGIAYRPALKVRVSDAHREEIPLWGLLDTGADDCILPLEIADAIRPIWSHEPGVIIGATGQPRAIRYGRVILRITVQRRVIRWAPLVGFDDRDEALWGVSGFLEHFRVTFDGPARHFTIRTMVPTPKGLTIDPIPRGLRKDDAIIHPDDQEP